MKRTLAMLLSVALLLLFGCTAASEAEKPGTSEPAASSASVYLESRLQAHDSVLYVYKDFVDGANHYTQKAWMGSNSGNVPAMREDAEGYSGISGIACEIDLSRHSWGGYMFINGILPEGQTDPVHDFGGHDAGLDLTGASLLAFYAKGESGGERVEFFMGGLGHDGKRTAPYADSTETVSLGYVTLSKEWERFEIPLDGVDLTRVGCGFGWVTNDRNNRGAKRVRFSLDDIRYEFAEGSIKPMFLQSYASVDLDTDGAVINNFAYLYDQCAAAMALSYAGKHERARQIADAIVYALENDRYYADGRLRNAYMCGNPQSYPGWFSARGKEFARLPGFYDTAAEVWCEDAYAVSAGSTGNIAWALLALCEVYENAGGNEAYLQAARQIADYVLTLETAHGFAGGYEGWEGSEIEATYLSTEHNTDLITAFGKLHKLTGEEKYKDASELAKAFVLSMYDAEKGCFYTGTQGDGATVSKDVIPLDCQTWTLLALGDEFKDSARVLRYIEENMAVEEGYDFDTDKDGVWYEGTAQTALAYLYAGNDAKYHEILDAMNARCLPDGSITAADRDRVTTGFTVGMSDIPWVYDERVHIGATAWLAFAQMGRNPFAY